MALTTKKIYYPATSDPPNGPAQMTTLAQSVDDALPGAWVTLVLSNPDYNGAIATSWTTLTDYSGGTVTVPSGRTLEVAFRAPKVSIGVSSEIGIRLKIGSSYPDSWRLISGPDGTLVSGMRLEEAIVGTGAGVSVSVEAIRVAGTGFVQGDGVVGPKLRYRIV